VSTPSTPVTPIRRVPTPSSREPVIVHVFGRTDVGRTREHNEDAFAVADLTRRNATLQPEVRTHEVGDRGTLFMVADGMGGAAAGEIASAMAIDVILREVTDAVSRATEPSEEVFATAIKRATAAANSHIHSFALEHPEYRGMGTTATVAGVLGDTIYLAQVGDSRAYLIRNGVGQQITKDQSLMQKLIEAGELTEEEAEQSERRNIILQALGPEATIKVDLTHQRVRRGDVLVLCSDGLSGQVRGEEIARIVSEEKDLVAACKRMIDRANENGGPDNITVIVARFDGAGLTDPDATDDVGHRTFPLATDSGPVDAVPKDASTRTTAEMEAVRRPTRELPVDAFLMPPPADDTAAKRRMRGSLIALALLIVFFAGALWYVYRVGQQVVAPRHGGTPTPTDSRP
jgi:serine/threonine protein phosphatase PrpC